MTSRSQAHGTVTTRSGGLAYKRQCHLCRVLALVQHARTAALKAASIAPVSHNFTRVTYDSGTVLHRGECPQVLHRYHWGGFMADRVCAADSLPCVRPKETRIGCRHDPITSGLPLIALSDAHPVAVIAYVSFHVDSCSYCDVLSHVSAFPGAPDPCHHHHCTARS